MKGLAEAPWGLVLGLDWEPRTYGPSFLPPTRPARSTETGPTVILMFVGWLWGMQNTFSHGNRFFLLLLLFFL